MGSNAQAAGAAFEGYLDDYHDILRARGVADVRKIPTPVQVVKRYQDGSSRGYERSSTVDYSGTLAGGLSVCFDAKSTADERRVYWRSVKDHQLEYLTAHAELGAIAFVLVECRNPARRQYFIPASVITSSLARGEKSLPWLALDTMRLPPGTGWHEFIEARIGAEERKRCTTH
jgi:recombination protein U